MIITVKLKAFNSFKSYKIEIVQKYRDNDFVWDKFKENFKFLHYILPKVNQLKLELKVGNKTYHQDLNHIINYDYFNQSQIFLIFMQIEKFIKNRKENNHAI